MEKKEKSSKSDEVIEGKVEEPEKSEEVEVKKPVIDIAGWKEKTGIGKKIKTGETFASDLKIEKITDGQDANREGRHSQLTSILFNWYFVFLFFQKKGFLNQL